MESLCVEFKRKFFLLKLEILVETIPSSSLIPNEAKKVETIKKEEAEESEEIELLSQAEKEDEIYGLSNLSDEDIFEKILRDDVKTKKDDEFEILGYRKDGKEDSYELMDKDREEKELEEENFYRKFLRHGKRVRKELPILRAEQEPRITCIANL